MKTILVKIKQHVHGYEILSDVKDAYKNQQSKLKEKIPWCTLCNMTSQSKMTSLYIVSYVIESTRKCHHNLYDLKCAMAGAYSKYYEEIFGTHLYQTLVLKL
jgi:hypothetical protein